MVHNIEEERKLMMTLVQEYEELKRRDKLMETKIWKIRKEGWCVEKEEEHIV